MDRGVAGFRFDALKHLFESTSMDDEQYVPGRENSTNFDDMIHKYTCDQPETVEIIYAWREFLDNYTIRKNSSFSRLVVIIGTTTTKL